MKLIILVTVIVFIAGCIVLRDRPGPPPHAKAHGYYKKYPFHYYPDLGIYWYPETKTYVVLEGGTWVEVTKRPVILTPSYSYVVIKTESLKPWLKHSYYKDKYPPGKTKIKSRGKGKGKK